MSWLANGPSGVSYLSSLEPLLGPIILPDEFLRFRPVVRDRGRRVEPRRQARASRLVPGVRDQLRRGGRPVLLQTVEISARWDAPTMTTTAASEAVDTADIGRTILVYPMERLGTERNPSKQSLGWFMEHVGKRGAAVSSMASGVNDFPEVNRD